MKNVIKHILSVPEPRRIINVPSALWEMMEQIQTQLEALPEEGFPPKSGDAGAGIYVIYYRGSDRLYAKLVATSVPIYIGKALMPGVRKSRNGHAQADNGSKKKAKPSSFVLQRLRQHAANIEKVGMNPEDFTCKYLILNNEQDASLAPAFETALIRIYYPLWNGVIDGFGNHDPGKGRYNQAPSDWDTLYPGRDWVEKLQGVPPDKAKILAAIEQYMIRLK